MIVDSGNRHEFETGAVRDIQEGKGRCDLMPLEVVTEMLGGSDFLRYIHIFQGTDNCSFLYSAIRQYINHDLRVDQCTAILEVSIHFEEGARKYGENNWQKGIPVSSYIDSAIRHYLKWLRGDTDERHDRAVIWNLMCCVWTREKGMEGV